MRRIKLRRDYRTQAEAWIKDDRAMLAEMMKLKRWTYRSVGDAVGIQPSALCRFANGKTLSTVQSIMLRLWLGENEAAAKESPHARPS
jgi:hypothetical protein